jgi:hypothetical protein
VVARSLPSEGPGAPRSNQLCLLLFWIFCLFVLVDWGLKSGLSACKAGAVPLEPLRQSICSAYFGDGGGSLKVLAWADPLDSASQIDGTTGVSHRRPTVLSVTKQIILNPHITLPSVRSPFFLFFFRAWDGT